MLNLRRLSTPSGRDGEPGDETSCEHRAVPGKPSDRSGDSERFQAYVEAAAGGGGGDSTEHRAEVIDPCLAARTQNPPNLRETRRHVRPMVQAQRRHDEV